jgi:bifunctional enzyme CysN/CysC
MPVQWVNRPNLDFRGFAGTIASGAVKPGDRSRAALGPESTVARIVTMDGDLPKPWPGQSVTLTLADEIDISRGDVLARAAGAAGVADQFEATIVWMADEPMLPGRPYLLKIGTRTVRPSPSSSTRSTSTRSSTCWRPRRWSSTRSASAIEPRPAGRLRPYAENRDTGGFILIDRSPTPRRRRHDHFALRRAHQRPLAGARRQQAARARAQGPEAVRAVVHRPVGRRQIDHRQPGRKEAARAGGTPICSTATTSATASTAIWASPTPTGSRTSAASPRWPS